MARDPRLKIRILGMLGADASGVVANGATIAGSLPAPIHCSAAGVGVLALKVIFLLMLGAQTFRVASRTRTTLRQSRELIQRID
jgi:hypothetical protein